MNNIELYKESPWIMQDDGTELKELIGQSDMGFHYGHLYSFPDSEMYWDSEPYDSMIEAKLARFDRYLESLELESEEMDKCVTPTDRSSNYDHNGEYIPF